MEPVRFPSADGTDLEGEIRLPDGSIRATAVLCHPHPSHGGSKDHPILWGLRNELAHRGFAVLGFNFRGIMGSAGRYDGGVAEVGDARGAIDRIRLEGPGAPTFLAGWSFGANVALREALGDPRVAALALIGFPLVEDAPLRLPPPPGPEAVATWDTPVLFVAGHTDRFCPAHALRTFARRFPRAEVDIVTGTGHFFHRRERELAGTVGRFAERALSRSSAG